MEPDELAQAPTLSPDEFRLRLAQVMDNEPDEDEEEEQRTPRQTGYSKVGAFFRSIGRGIMKAADETSRTMSEALAPATEAANMGKAAFDPQAPKDAQGFMEWYGQKTSEVNPLQFGADRRERWLGPDATGVLGFVEGVSQFAASFIAFKKIAGAGKAAGYVKNMAVGALTDASSFDPHQARLSNIIESAPFPIQNAITRYLAADEDDSVAEGRLKAALEGTIIGGTADVLIAGFRWMKGGKAPAAAASRASDEVVDVRANGDGTYSLTPTEAQRLRGVASKIATDGDLEDINRGIDEAAPKFESAAEAQTVAASINRAVRVEALPKGSLTPEQVTRLRGVAQRIATGEDLDDFNRLLDGTDFNFNYVQSSDEAKSVIEAISEVLPRDKTPQTHAQTVKMAEDLLVDMDGVQAVEAISGAFKNTVNLPQVITAVRTYMYDLGQRIADLSLAADTNADNPVAMDQLSRALSHLFDLHHNLAGTSTNVARTLNAHQIAVTTSKTADVLVDAGKATATTRRAPLQYSAVSGLTPREIRALARKVRVAEGDPKAILAAIKETQAASQAAVKPGIMDRLVSYRIEAMLSGPKTQLVNAISNATNAFVTPVEYWWAGLRTGNTALREEGADILTGLALNFRDSWRAAGKAMRAGSNMLDAESAVSDMMRAAPMGTSWISKLVHTPSRLLMTTDEFFKQMNYRSVVRAKSLRLARADGIADPALLAQRVADDMAAAFSLNGSATDEIALAYTRTATYTEALDYGLGKTLQDAAQKHALVRIVVPFVRTPTNLFRWSWKHTPGLNRFQRQHADDIAAGGERAALALARTEMGMAIYGTAATLALQGNITGAGPSNPALRSQWLAAGNQPYSVKLPNGRWVSYRRGDPFTAPLGLVADAVAIASEMDEEEWGNIASASLASIASNISSKTYMQGIADFMDAAASGDGWKMEKLLTNTALSFVPNLLRQVNPDDTLRETRSLLDETMGRLPGFSEKLEPRRNLLGEPIMRPPGYLNNAVNPFTVSRKDVDVNVQDRLVELGKAMAMPAEKIAEGRIDLTDRQTWDNGTGQSPYDRMLSLIAEPGDGKKNLRTALEELVTSERWERASDGTASMPGGMRYLMASRLITAHQQRAEGRMLKEYPKLFEAMKQDPRTKGAAIMGGEDAVDRVEALFGN
jgi:hypothetical protein